MAIGELTEKSRGPSDHLESLQFWAGIITEMRLVLMMRHQLRILAVPRQAGSEFFRTLNPHQSQNDANFNTTCTRTQYRSFGPKGT